MSLVSGSIGGGLGDANTFYDGIDVHAVDFLTGDAPMHPSYEDRDGAPDRCFARIDDEEYGRHVTAWSRALEQAGAADADVLDLHHLTPLNEAAARVAPDVPVVGHLHGTELEMLEAIAAGPPTGWKHAEAWARRMRRWAGQCERLIVHTAEEVESSAKTLGLSTRRFVVVPGGFDAESFRPAPVNHRKFWHRHLVEEPQGWKPGGKVGSVSYTDDQVAVLDDAVILMAIGRFTILKRLDLLIRAFENARRRTGRRVALILVGGHPGEWQGEHPVDTIKAAGAKDVFLAGWHGHDALPEFLNAADIQVHAATREQFGLVLVEGMSCGLPTIAVNRFGPKTIVKNGKTGWLVPPDDEAAFADAIVSAVDDGEERSRRGIAARRRARDRWSWPILAGSVAQVLNDAAGAGLRTDDDSAPVLPVAGPPIPG